MRDSSQFISNRPVVLSVSQIQENKYFERYTLFLLHGIGSESVFIILKKYPK